MLTEALLSTVAEAVFSTLLQEIPLADRVRAVLRGDPERKAFQVALARAYTTFAQHHPDLTASLFDQQFLCGPAAPLLAQLLTRRGQPDPADLARLWAQHLGRPDPDTWPRLSDATRAAADFLRWLDAELANQPALQELRDSRALERIADNTEAIRSELVKRSSIKYPITGIENFLALYRSAPFGGRDADLRRLNDWLDDPHCQHALLIAPAGQGKSALLVRWLDDLCNRRPKMAVVFVPVSVRFGTNLASVTFAALTARLAALFDDQIPTDPNMPDTEWREMFSDYLKRPSPHGLLVIIDGVDEAANWDVSGDLVPRNLPEGTKVLLSARQTTKRQSAADWQQALA